MLQDSIQASDPSRASQLLKHPQLWRAGQLNRRSGAPTGLPTGYAELDAQLPGGGWPQAGLAEVLHGQPGLGELRLLAPVLSDLTDRQNRWVAWVRPPAIPYAPALGRLGMRSDRMLMIHPKTHADALWAAEQAARSGTCSAVLIWLDEGRLNQRETRRLQVAARQGGSLACLFRAPAAARQPSAAELRLELSGAANAATPGRVQLDILKRRGGWAVDGIELQLVGEDPVQDQQDIIEQLSLWQDQQSQLHTPDNVAPNRREATTPSGSLPSQLTAAAAQRAELTQQPH